MKEVGVVAVMLTAELLDVIVNTVSKAAMKKGMNDFVFVMYSNAFAACFLFLITLIFYRKRTLPPLSYNIVGLFFVVGLISCSNQMFKFFGIGYSSPTLASALSDLIPAFTFILAIIFRMEKFVWKANSTVAKSIGTFVSISGALIMSLYKGQAVINSGPSLKLLPKKLASSMEFDWVFGAALLAAHSCFLSINYILLTRIVREYPAELVVVLTRIALVSILSVPAAVISVKDLKDLRLGFNMELIAIGCSAIFVLSFRGVIHTWAMGKRGPVYVAMFKPLEIVFAVILGITFLGDNLYVGSVIGAAIVVIGFYAVIWGKSQEKVEEEGAVYSSESYSTEAPLLQNQRIGE
ncbi:WAT1-related protein At3g28050 isoform X1 [Cajanus cajan]|uniref:WAT1-related protein n=1 Tax=Cajanus cajan TaxID=3821 RepID=A0A151QWR5_CAJCA|nr:WAT1-related protein At3g28050 isoform X1 [Cajanus cajan]KYP34716.1 Auxin-induced protein 5NG4 [Cajanus cajan]